MVSRQCIACRLIRPVSTLWRFIRNLDGQVEFDLHQVFDGRGAYVCQNSKCLEQAIHRKAFARAFKKPILSISIPTHQE